MGILTLVIGRWLVKVITRYASRSMERARVESMVVHFVRTLIYVGLEVLEQMKLRFDEAGISKPYPSQEVYVHQTA